MQLIGTFERFDHPRPAPPVGKVVLLVDPDRLLLEAGKLLLSGLSELVQTASTCLDVSTLPPDQAPQIVVLSERLGPFQLVAVAEYVRHRWPRARIFVVGRPDSFLKPHLYDEVLDLGPSNLDFLAAIEECIRTPEWRGMQPN